MKNFLVALLLLTAGVLNAQKNWTVAPEKQKVFIENKGQFDNLNNVPGSKILFGTENIANQILFTKEGVTYRLEERVGPTKEEREEREEEMKDEILKGKTISHKEMEEREGMVNIKKDFVQVQWLNANPNVEVVALNTVNNYFNYGMGSYSINHLNGYKKILYKNLYPNIDVEYVFHPTDGIEYNFILYPGADPSQIKMKYSDVDKVTVDKRGNVHLSTMFGDIIEHAPKTYYEASGREISSKFVRNGKIVTFQLANYDRSQKVVIDPWVQAPSFASQWDCVWECEKDGAGNVYIIGGVTPMQLLKYDPSGTLLWTYSTPYDTTSWLGTFATDNAGNSYVTQGSVAAIQKISTAGALVWNNPNPGGIFASTEFWSISFNCDETKLVIGGTGNTLPPQPYIYEVDMSNGNVTSNVRVTGGALIPTQEVRSITACGNGKYYFLTHDSIGYLNQNFSVCGNNSQAITYNPNSYGLGYKCENFRYNNTGIEAIKSYGAFVFTHRGNQLHKRDFTTGAILATATIPGGAYTTQFGSSFVENTGLDIDNCGNIYVGSKNQVVKFDQSLTQLATYATTFNVYDVQVSTNGDIIACGSTGTSSSGARQGYIQSIAASACAPIAITCCDASVCKIGPFCNSDGPVALTPSTPGGTWSGPGVSGGVFNPATAGAGVHYVKYNLPCGSDSIRVVVNACAALQACLESNGSVTVSAGTSPYTWYNQVQQQSCANCVLPALCFPPGCETTINVWQTFATGSNATPPNYPVRIVDNSSNELIITNASQLQNCSVSCALTASATPTATTCGSNNGGVTVATTGATPTGYAWSNGSTSASLTNVAAGSYTVTVSASGCTATATATVASSSAVTASASSTAAGCTSTGTATATINGGTASAYSWSNGGNTQTINSLAAGTYTVTVTSTNNCTATASTVVGSSGGLVVSATTTNATCSNANGSATVTVSSGTATGYTWSNGATSATASNLAGGTYTVTVTGTGGCSATASAVVSNTGAPAITTSVVPTGCNGNTGSATVTVTSGTATSYAWSNGATGATASNLASGNYTVTVTGTGGCTVTASVTINSTGGIVISASSTNTSCGNNNGTATISVTQGNANSFAWSNGATTSSQVNLAAGTYTVTVTDIGGCTASASVVVGGSGSGNVAITSANTKMCVGDSIEICAPANYVSYLWNNGQTGRCVWAKQAGNYYVTVTDNGNCTASSNVIGITVYQQPPVSISVNGDTLVAYNASSYQWYRDGILIPGATNPVFVPTQSGSYTVVVSNANGCTAQSLPVVITVTGVEEIGKETMSVYPNPNATSQWNISVSQHWLGATCEVFDDRGRLVYQAEIKNERSLVDLNVASGVYMMKVTKGSKSVSQKLIRL